MSIKAVIMAGGKGTRVAGFFPDIPKPMIPICKKPLLQHQVETLVSQGFRDIIIVTGYMSEAITSYFENGAAFGANISYLREKTPLGTGGALALLPKDDYLVIFGDIYFQADFANFINFHAKSEAAITLFAHPNSHPADSDIIIADFAGRVSGWAFKNTVRGENLRNLVNAGLYVLSENALPRGAAEKRDLDKEIVFPMIATGGVFAYRSAEYVKDMGTPSRIEAVERDITRGVCAAKTRSRPQRAVFFDRDGVLNRENGFIANPEQLELLPGAGEAVALVNKSEFLAICVTNQPVIARGEVSFGGLDEIHGRLDNLLAMHGAYLDDLFFCPHHPDSGFAGEVAEYKIECGCRKPKPGLLLAAAERYNIDLSSSWIIGDRTADIAAGVAAGCKTIGVRTGASLRDGKCEVKPDYMADGVLDAVRVIL